MLTRFFKQEDAGGFIFCRNKQIGNIISENLRNVIIYECITNHMVSHAGSRGNDFYNYLCLEIPSCKEVNMPPAENRNSFSSSIISGLFFNQSLKLLLLSRGPRDREAGAGSGLWGFWPHGPKLADTALYAPVSTD